MQYLISSLLFLLVMSQNAFAKDSRESLHLFQIVRNDKIGFIDSAGNIIIDPQFLAAGDFSEGLAAARLNGKYGFINESGHFVISPQFDFALSFSEGLAIAYYNGRPFYINNKGSKAFNCPYANIYPFHNGRAKVETFRKHQGYIDKEGKLIIDTVFSIINPFIDGLAVVKRARIASTKKAATISEMETAVIDTLGNVIIEFGKYSKIHNLSEGYFNAEIAAKSRNTLRGEIDATAFVSRNGTVAFIRRDTNGTYIDGDINCGLAKIALYKYWLEEEKGIDYSSDKAYEGYVNLRGELVINDTEYKHVNDFSSNRAFVEDDNQHFFIIDTRGNTISNKLFTRFLDPGFKNGIAFVSVNYKWGVIDTNANFIIQPSFEKINEIGMVNDCFFFTKVNESTEVELTGIADKNGRIIVSPIIQQIGTEGFNNGLLRCIIDNKTTYINKTGNIVWQQNDSVSSTLKKINIDYMVRGHFYVNQGSKTENRISHVKSNNVPKVVTKHFPIDGLQINVYPSMLDTFSNDYYGMKVFVKNLSKQIKKINAQDNRLYMQVQALDKNKKWRDIEYLANSGCGNSYHTLSLLPNSYWVFTAPEYTGDFKTKFRIKLEYLDDKSKVKTVYSNEYNGSVNPGQFWRRSDYQPTNIMDPYDD